MKKTIIITTLISSVISSILTGMTLKYTKSENLVNMQDVTSVEVTETGILLNFKDGSGYYIER